MATVRVDCQSSAKASTSPDDDDDADDGESLACSVSLPDTRPLIDEVGDLAPEPQESPADGVYLSLQYLQGVDPLHKIIK